MQVTRQHGLSMIEFALVAVIFSILIAVATGYARTLAVRYEQASLEYAVNSLRAGIALKFARLAIDGELNQLAGLAGGNPMEWLESPLPLYRGRVSAPDYERISPGSWFYDEREEVLVYVIKNVTRSETARVPPRIRYRVRIADPQPGALSGLELETLDRPYWH